MPVYEKHSIRKLIRLGVFFLSLMLLIAASPLNPLAQPESATTQLATVEVTITGVKGKVLANIKARLKELNQLSPVQLESDDTIIQQTANAMSPYGFFKPVIRLQRGNKQLHIIIQPGPPLLINQLTVHITGEGAHNAKIAHALQKLPIKQHDPVNTIQYEAAKQRLLDAAEHQGYVHATFEKAEISIDKARYTASIHLILNTGPQFYFGQVQFSPSYISPDLLHRYIPFQYGQPYSTEQLMAFNSYLSGSGYFSQASVKPEINDNEHMIPITVYLKDAPKVNYSLGLGFGTDTGIRGRAGIHVAPVNPAGDKFNALALGSFYQNSLLADYIIPGRNPLTDEYHISANLSSLNYSSGYSNSLLTSFAQHHKRDNFQRILSLNGLYERFNYETAPKMEKLSLFPKASLSWTNTSNQLFSPSGYNVTVNGLVANRAVLSEVSFAQASIDARAALTIDPLRTRFYFHTLQGITQIHDINQMPLSLALLLGGADNLKAYTFNAIGPGKIVTYGGMEIQKETVDHWYFTGFFDAGDVYNPDVKALKYDVGLGLMWVSPIGPIKVGVAQGIDSRFNRFDDKRPRLVISMGPDL